MASLSIFNIDVIKEIVKKSSIEIIIILFNKYESKFFKMTSKEEKQIIQQDFNDLHLKLSFNLIVNSCRNS
jgi:hypothetical protein